MGDKMESENKGGNSPLCGSKVNSAFHPSEVDQLSTSNSWELDGKK